MVIDPAILIPAASLAVLAMVLFIRWMTGPKNRILTENSIRQFLALEETGVKIHKIIISQDNRYAIAHLEDTDAIRLIRSFGDSLVMQSLSQNDIFESEGKLSIRRQDISHPSASIDFAKDNFTNDWKALLFDGPKTGAAG